MSITPGPWLSCVVSRSAPQVPLPRSARSREVRPTCPTVPYPIATSADPATTLKSTVPVRSDDTAVGAADLGYTLNAAEAITVFAPTNDAFSKIPKADLEGVLADKDLLTKILTHHVVAGQLGQDEVAGEHETLAGAQTEVKGSGEELTVGKENEDRKGGGAGRSGSDGVGLGGRR